MAAADTSSEKSAGLEARKALAGKVYAALAKAIPEPKAELQYSSVYELLTAVMLSAQATDKSVNAVTGELFRLAPTPERMLELGEERVRDIVRTVGLANTKARHIIEAAGILVSEFGGNVPETIEELVRLPGVGEKTAKVVLNVGFGKGVIAVDTHILRVAHRLGLSQSKTPAGVSRDLEAITPTEYIRNAHHYLLLHGRYTCRAQKPLCGSCALRDLCRSSDSAEEKKSAQGKG
ncbi:MAG: endonuclease III [Succinivibrionaceae bacterium]|nr:endonuclease III [Succinivibrionaceae bacterium]